ncbi:hypothetical protein RHMOL_Rhmol04G0149400 [Rhododendron molle]|uniref:Uncharacterized protein n=1 Tax=Rhododendron molle TaxID=49168 RepID=A0ACC0P2Z4_RHOML|nr:hypothetical protein RHMOL_Rhmol04G0149400 [Rhododendron molle]
MSFEHFDFGPVVGDGVPIAGDEVPVAGDDVWSPEKRETEGFRSPEMELRSPEMWREFDFSRLFGWVGEKPKPFLLFSH